MSDVPGVPPLDAADLARLQEAQQQAAPAAGDGGAGIGETILDALDIGDTVVEILGSVVEGIVNAIIE